MATQIHQLKPWSTWILIISSAISSYFRHLFDSSCKSFKAYYQIKVVKMAFKGNEMGLALVLVTMLLGRATAQSSCTSTLTSLAPCLNYVTGSSSNPSSSCCSQFSNVVQSSPQCLCSLLNGGGSTLGITINKTLALSLPGACNVKTPPVSQCQCKPSKFHFCYVFNYNEVVNL